MDTPLIAFIGAGNMAASIVGGLLESGYPAGRIRAADPFEQSLARIGELGPVATGTDNNAAVDGADVIILAVKPQIMGEVCQALAPALAGSGALVISIAAGITIDSLRGWLGQATPIVRCMPNTPALVGCGATGLYATDDVSEQQRAHATQILEAVGLVEWVGAEIDLDAVIAVSGSGPAYFFLFMEAMIEHGERLGLDRDTATRLAQQTALGAARMALENDVDVVELRRRVTSPGGTTQAAIESFEAAGLRRIVQDAMQAAVDRAAEMAREMG
ncbi:pyrroline-5-carboxylate reductase [Mangrovimicrobium sediminis]|uniref:Pyrroline-5-carboxylate reductase n=1 Tax=Mangrovimicrobium sediminis TaxID=2562682 RepID=A0A4Z0LZA9_9GAMM|nr:pyrroline-5-carboxylate reductase [Haliea sp. SAOS-164]TGD72723.1 pyrroline-5-carboxylate reductase [Haliea sp. SAOS-164]